MSKRLSLLVGALCAAAITLPAAAGAVQPIKGQYVVVLKDGASGRAVAAEHARAEHAQVLQTYDAALHGYTAKLSDAALAKVKADPRVKEVVQDVSGVLVESQTLPTGVNRIDADLSATAQLAGNGSGTVNGDVAVFDTGIETSHPDLNVAGGVNCLDSSNTANDHTYNDEYGHGTHVAGIIGAKDDLAGVVGVAPGVRLWSVRVADKYAISTLSSHLCGVNWITANGPSLGIKVVNASTGMYGQADDGNCGNTVGDVVHQAVCNSTAAGILWVFAAGNSSGSIGGTAGAGWPEGLTVTAMADGNGQPNVPTTATLSCGSALNRKTTTKETDDKYASFSNYAVSSAQIAHTVAAPGACIWSTFKGQTYGYLSGTSMAAPHVTATVELCILSGACAGLPADTIQKIRSDAATYTQSNTKYGFTGDPLNSPVVGRYYGYLVRAGLY